MCAAIESIMFCKRCLDTWPFGPLVLSTRGVSKYGEPFEISKQSRDGAILKRSAEGQKRGACGSDCSFRPHSIRTRRHPPISAVACLLGAADLAVAWAAKGLTLPNNES